MTYPKTILTSKIRKAINIFLILSFFIISPIVILYTTGYRYDFQTGQVSQTGVIGIDAEPKNAKVFLNNIEIKQDIPIRITNLTPDVYSIRIELEGYHIWEKDINVKSKKSTFVNNISLYKKSNPIPILNSFENIVNVDFSQDGKYALLTSKKEDIYEVKLFETNSKQISTITRTTNEEIPETSWSPFGNSAFIKTINDTNTTIDIFSTAIPDNANSFIFETKYLDKNIQWKNSTLPTIFIKENHKIKQLGLTGEKTITSNLNENNWFVDEKNNIWIIDNTKKSLKRLGSRQNDIPYKIGQFGNKIIDINSQRAILNNSQKTTIIKLDTQESETIKTNSFIFDQQNNKWISWSPLEIWEISENGDSNLINRTSDRIKTVNHFNKFGVLLLTSESSISTFDRNYLLSHELLENTAVKEISVNKKKQAIFFWGIVDGTENFFELEY
ncbi:MAG: PEGA domain-containing protein [Candidatus Magasanikbacteria bacterium]|nr:PEGA domain-containing protein [Candidatus Magasanikbacteria bacterium]